MSEGRKVRARMGDRGDSRLTARDYGANPDLGAGEPPIATDDIVVPGK